jgi:RNA polymerase sigma-70 factor (ECF subfamily)
MEPSDEVLMVRYARGDGEAFEELFRRYECRAYGFFLRRTRSPDRASDLFQELFLRLHRFREAFDPERPFAHWFFQIARNVLIDDFRRSFRSSETSVGGFEPGVAADVEERTGQREELEGLLGRLSSEQTLVLLAAKGEGLRYSEIAAALGKSVESVRQTASRALRRLRAGVRA